MSHSALAELENTLLSLDEIETWDSIVAEAAPSELVVRSSAVVPLTSDFATMGGGRPRTMF
jgi:hypothetical protein